jgi:hypothetical protein
MTQWHPLFAQLLRPMVEGYFEVETNVPVGDAPREADIVLLRRTTTGPLPFQGLWKHLTTWNVLEYKGPTGSARLGDLDLLAELGLGVHRRLNEERMRRRQRPLPPEQVSWWLVAHRLGARFIHRTTETWAALTAVQTGVWRTRLLRRWVYLISGATLPVDRDSVPLHLMDRSMHDNEVAAARLVAGQDDLWKVYGPWVLGMHGSVLEELRKMARSKGNPWGIKLEPMVELLGMDKVLELLGPDRVIQQLGPKRIIKSLGVDRLLDEMSPAERAKLKRRLREE